MKTLINAVLIVTLSILVPATVFAKVPCEETLKDVRSARADAKLNDAGTAKVDELITKGIDRCNADDDNRANDFFKDAMTAMGK
ncbi:hypothetical protein LRX75_20930 [Rhizobium sp. DKSPLA3]|uniref:Uncharacterized protein n=1 Tax=Rhizobium quercicola TaxID=2901226 RepID=A0A9X1T2X5_9HYPH|nr:hypothetical protein [Rhizobium quercicola]MCD7111504.1 hypothetical protein [Rhizobium quercicola]